MTRWVLALGLVGALGACNSEERTFDETGGDGGSENGNAGSGGESGEGGASGSSGNGGDAGSGGDAGASGNSGAGAEGGSGAASGEGGSGGSAGSSGSGGSGGGCTDNDECQDENVCNGEETCKTGECLRGENAETGTPCTVAGETGSHFCTEGNCVLSRCGDLIVDSEADEECDDGNSDDADGCDSDCTYSCSDQSECDDAVFCNGRETCALHVCAPGEPEADGTPCGTELACRQGECMRIGCGNGIPEPDHGEECDDGNTSDADGCDNDCTFSCEEDLDCSDASVCTGSETCDLDKHVCLPGTPLECEDEIVCTENACDPTTGCHFPLIDEDNDGHAATGLGACGDDCDDGDSKIYGGAAELCDGKDNDCDEDVDEEAPVWWVDCDGDGLAASNALSQQGCVEPPRWQGCPAASAGRWTSIQPESGTTDCWDSDPDVHTYADSDVTAYHTTPIVGRADAVDFDYDCDGAEELRFTLKATSCSTVLLGGCTGSGWIDGTVPTCGAPPEAYRSCGRVGKYCLLAEGDRSQECR